MTATRTIDARGMLCPWPALRLSRFAREAREQGSVVLLADDPIAPGEVARLCEERGWTCRRDADDAHRFDIRFG